MVDLKPNSSVIKFKQNECSNLKTTITKLDSKIHSSICYLSETHLKLKNIYIYMYICTHTEKDYNSNQKISRADQQYKQVDFKARGVTRDNE